MMVLESLLLTCFIGSCMTVGGSSMGSRGGAVASTTTITLPAATYESLWSRRGSISASKASNHLHGRLDGHRHHSESLCRPTAMRKITCDPQGRRERLQRIMRTYSTPSSSSSSSQATTSPSPQKSKRRFWRPWRRQQKKPGTLVLLRHGESHWNLNNSFTGWADPDLTADGCAEVRRAARLLLERGYKPEVIYTSRLKRAIRSSFILLKEMNLMYRPLFKEYELNERMYGALTGMSKSQIALTFGEELVQQWRRSLDVRPPELDEKHPYWPGNERKYNDIPRSKIPKTESLHDTMNRAVPLFKKKIEKDLRDGKDVLVVAHYNSLRGLVKHIDSIDTDEIRSVEIPTGIPLVYEFDVDMKPIRSNFSGQGGMSGSFLATPEVTQAALKRERELSQDVPGFTDSPLVTPVLRAISSLQRERESLFKERKHDASIGNTRIHKHMLIRMPLNTIGKISTSILSVSLYVTYSIIPTHLYWYSMLLSLTTYRSVTMTPPLFLQLATI